MSQGSKGSQCVEPATGGLVHHGWILLFCCEMTALTKHLPPRLPVARSCSRQTQDLPKTFTMVLAFYFVIPSVLWGSFRSSNPNNNECKSKRAFHQGTNPETTHLYSEGLAAYWWVPQPMYSTVLCFCDHLPGAEQKPKTWIRCRKITEPDSSPVWTGWDKESVSVLGISAGRVTLLVCIWNWPWYSCSGLERDKPV